MPMIIRVISMVIGLVISTVIIAMMRDQWIILPMLNSFVNMTVMVKFQFNKPTISVQQDVIVTMTVLFIFPYVSDFKAVIVIIYAVMNILG